MAPSKAVLDFLEFVNASPTPYHAVRSAIARLEKADFSALRERDAWSSSIRPGGRYYLTRNGSSIVAFTIGQAWRPGNPVAIVGAHTDSPCLRIKPVSKKSNAGFVQVGVETYGGGIWHSWFDRDLSIAGRAMVREGDKVVQKLVHVKRPILRIPTLAIHLDRSASFEPNKETQLFPIAGLVETELNKAAEKEEEETSDEEEFRPLKKMEERHHPQILDVVASEAGVDAADIVDFELVLYDTQKACLGGLNDELIFSARLDNLGMTYCSVMGLIKSVHDPSSLEADTCIRMTACFDHEEIGSVSAQGAASSLLSDVLRRLSLLPLSATSPSDDSYEHLSAPEQSTAFEQMMTRSFLLSADMAHSVHPNYQGKYESSHQPRMNGGTVIKINANQRYATNSPGIVLTQQCAAKAGVPLQLFVVRNDSPCGSTIGPMLSAKLGIRTLDCGNPQLSMHSIRETGGADDVEHGVKLFSAFFEYYYEMESKIFVE